MTLIKDLTQWIAYYPMRQLIGFLPRNVLYFMSQTGGWISYHLRKNRRILVLKQLENLLGNQILTTSLPTIARKGFKLAFLNVLLTFRYPKLNGNNIQDWITLAGEDHLKHALEAGKGAIIVLVHFGANQMVMPALGYHNYKINQLGSRPEDWNRLSGIKPSFLQKKLFKARLKLEKTLPANFIYIDKSLKPVYRCLARNEIMIMAVDGRAGTKFISVPIFNMFMNLSAGPFRIAASTGTPIIPAFPVLQKKGRHLLFIEAPINPPSIDDRDVWIQELVSAYAKILEKRLVKYPDHYCMLMAEAERRAPIDTVPLFTSSQQDMVQ
ncbi:lysophospholipid acyltransferase family protein [bacterium]|nr:lysophospholipid acyltransferase family protein [candidate division CSSED10-310 bacterium]